MVVFVVKKHTSLKYQYGKAGYAFIGPAILWISVFVYVPLIMAIIRVFQDYNTHEFVGWENFDYVLKTPTFVNSFKNVIIMTLIITFLMTFLSFGFASLISKVTNEKVAGVIKAVIYLPNLLSGVIVCILFNLLINEGYGLFAALRVANGEWPIKFSTEGLWPYISIIIPSLWVGIGYNTLVMLAGLLNVPKEYYEAARIDGANSWQILWHITLPNMKNYFVLIISSQITSNLQMLEIPMWITGGGPLEKTMTPTLYLFNTFRDSGRSPNVAIAGALIIMVLVATLNIISFKILHHKKSEAR